MSAAEQRETFEAIVDAQVLQQSIDCLTSIVDEAVVHLTEDGIHTAAVDPANVAMVWLDIHTSAFESYQASGGEVGLNLNRFDERTDVANAGDLVHLALNAETMMLDVTIRNADMSMACFDPDSVRSEPELPGIDDKMDSMFVCEAETFDEAIGIADLVSDHVAIRSDPETGEVHVEAQGDTDDTDVTLGQNELIDGHIEASCESLYSLDYLLDMVKPIPAGAEVQFRHGEEFPLPFEFEFAEGHAVAEMMLAPRIVSR